MMTRKEIFAYALEKYDAEPEYLWIRTPNYAVLRHRRNRKWFAAVVDIMEDMLGLKGEKLVDVLNLKCDPLLVSALRSEPGIFPAYHMNKENWISVLLSSAISKESVFHLLDQSYELTR